MQQVSIAFITYKGKILLLHRDNKPTITSPNKWGLIGDHVESGETPEQGLAREAKEEINLDVKNYSLLLHIFLDREDGKVEYFYYHIPVEETNLSEIKLQEEGQAIKFKTWDEMKKLDLTVSLTKFLSNEESVTKLRNILSNES